MSLPDQPSAFDWDLPEIAALIRAALDEDLGPGDLTTESTVSPSREARAHIMAKQGLVLAGLPLAERVFRTLDPGFQLHACFPEGASLSAGQVVAQLNGRARAMLSAERTAMNFLAHLSGIATLTRRFVEAIAGTHARIRDTRKTTPLLRQLEKYAVRIGGGTNHRFGLFDAILIKENHIAIAGGIAAAFHRAQQFATDTDRTSREITAYESFRRPAAGEAHVPIQIEVRSESEVREALTAGADSLLLDNLPPAAAAPFVALVRRERPACVVEVSGGVTLANVRAYAEAGVDFISVGALTHSAPAADLSLLVEPPGSE